MSEIALVYPCHETGRRRYVIHDADGSIKKMSMPSAVETEDAPERLLGSASASPLGDGGLLTTCALVQEPTVLSVALLKGTKPPILVELDLGQATIFGIPVKIQCFAEYSSLLLRMVDSTGIVLSITLDEELTPTGLSLLSIPNLVEKQQGFASGAELDAAMVLFLSSSVLIVGLSPHLLAVNLTSQHMVIWSETQTVEEMKSRRLGRILSKAGYLLMGGPQDDNLDDMSPTAALCQAGGEFIFSLHSDASVRRWRVDGLHPVEVIPLPLADIPEEALWSDAQGAVAMCAQLYEHVYALAIHVQTVGGDDDASPCRLTVVHGPQQVEEDAAVRSSLHLSVPAAATSLVGMDFAQERCRLTALFQSQEKDMNSTLLVTYPHSVVSIVSTQPQVTPHEYILDGVAAIERQRISELTFPVAKGNSLEQDLHTVDSAFLKYLFRPACPRGSGGVTPSPSSIRSAIRKLVPGHHEGDDMSIECETLRAMHEWRRSENRGGQTRARPSESNPAPSTPGTSIYDSYAVEDPEGTPDMEVGDMEDVENEEDDLLDQERAAQLDSHEARWRSLLLTIWEEEESLRDPLCFSCISSTDTSTFGLIRTGITSLVREFTTEYDAVSRWEDLDKAAMILLDCIEKSQEGSADLFSIETRVYDVVSKASLEPSSTGESCSIDFSRLGRWALEQVENSRVNREDIETAFGAASQDEILEWVRSVESVFLLALPGVCVLPDGADLLGDDANQSWSNRVAPAQTRLAASNLYLQCSDSVRRLRMGRILLLSSIGEAILEGGQIFNAAFREYLNVMSVLWSCAQLVPMHARPRNLDFGVTGASPSDSPPAKRVSFGDYAPSILPTNKVGLAQSTTVLDARLIQISHELGPSMYSTKVPDGAVLAIVRVAFDSTFAAGPSGALPELGALPTPSDQTVASDYPRIALRLLAPFLAYPPKNDDEETIIERKEAIAECLLIEANAASHKRSISESKKSDAMRTKACDLLVPTSSERSLDFDHNLLKTVFVTLRNQSQSMPSLEESSLDEIARAEEALASELHLLMSGTSSPPGTDTIRLCQQPTVRSIFLPLMRTEHQSFFRSLDNLPRDYVKALVEVLLRVSNLMHRLSILERHTENVGGLGSLASSESIDFLLGYIESAISEVQRLLPEAVYSSMAEYATLWTLLFHHAVASQKWTKAHNVCVNHPIPDRRISIYKRLVIAIADAGAFTELLDLCSILDSTGLDEMETEDGDGVACIDLYEIAAETLVEANQGNPYATGSGIGATDYLGCLYALYASRGHWKRAAQAMDARYAAASQGVTAPPNEMSSLLEPINAAAAMDDLALTSLCASNAVQLIRDPSSRFVVSGELGPYPILPIMTDAVAETSMDDVEALSRRNKRGRGDQGDAIWSPRRVNEAPAAGVGATSRLSRFMTVIDLNARAVRAMALRIIVRDQMRASSDGLSRMLEAPTPDDRACIDHLASLGYFHEAILLAKVMCMQYEAHNGGTKPAGRDVLQDSISHILTTYIVPFALNQGNFSTEDEMDTDANASRPTLSQLWRTIEEVGRKPEKSCSFVLGDTWYPTTELSTVAKASAAMEATRKLTSAYTNADSPIAQEVAGTFLDLDPHGAALPTWLERLLLGAGENALEEDLPGLFSLRSKVGDKSYKGDPPALLWLYVRRGMYTEACAIVSGILTGTLPDGRGMKSRETRAPSRLPEKGDIDYVPYDMIDLLWNLIDQACNDSTVVSSEKKKLGESRATMEKALEKHFELMKISELGSRSARALA